MSTEKAESTSLEYCSTILVVDDEPAVLMSYEAFLIGGEGTEERHRLRPHRLLSASTGEEAVQLVQLELDAGRQIAAGFFDMRMPGMDGLTTMRKVRALMPHIMCTVVTAHVDYSLSQISAVFTDGTEDEWDYLSKPFSENEIVQKARHVVASWNRRRGEEKRREELTTLGQELESRVDERTRALNEACNMLARKAGRLEHTLEELQDARSQLVRSEQLAVVGRLASMVAHEINNPAAYVLSNLELIEEFAATLSRYTDVVNSADAEKRRDWERNNRFVEQVADLPEMAADCLDGIRRIAQIVRDLKGFGRVGTENVETIDIEALLKRSVAIIANKLNHTARVDIDLRDLPPTVGHSNRLVQVFINLLINAQQAFAPGSSPQDGNAISVRGQVDESEIVVTIADNGPGIPEDIQQEIFAPFFTTKTLGEGSGLGLSVCRSIIDDHKGTIGFESKVGEGTRFWLRLPIVSSAMLSVLTEEQHVQQPRDMHQLHSGRILLIDDDEQVARAVSRGLRQLYAVDTAHDGASGLRELTMHPPRYYDVIICDVMMPGMSGADFYHEALLTRPEVEETTIFMTGGVFSGDERTFIDSGVRWLEKPVPLQELSAIIEALMEGELENRSGQLND